MVKTGSLWKVYVVGLVYASCLIYFFLITGVNVSQAGPIEDGLGKAIGLVEAGRFSDAEGLYRQLLAQAQLPQQRLVRQRYEVST